MKQDRSLPSDSEVFRQVPRITLADVLAQTNAEYSGTALRDTRSAFRAIEQKASVDLEGTVATAANLREIFSALSPFDLGISAKRFANIRSCVTRAVAQFGQPRIWVTKEIPLLPSWAELLGRIDGKHQYRWGLSRLACFCSVKGIDPEEVNVETLRGLYSALDGEAVSKDPRNLLKHTIACWNYCRKNVQGWPDIRLHSPFKSDPYMLPIEAFPHSFQRAVATWEERLRDPDPFDPTAPNRACRPETLQAYRYTFRRMASALVRSGEMQIEEITGFEVFFDEAHFKSALRPFLPGKRIKTKGYAHKMAAQMLAVGRYQLGFDEVRLEPFERIAQRLKPLGGPLMGDRNRKRLEQFDDDTVVARLLRFPEEELERAMRTENLLRRAKGVERALAISLAIFTGLRVKNLRQLHLERNIRRSGARVFIRISEEEAKSHEALELELPPETIALLDLFVADHRGVLPGSVGPYLFAGEKGGPRSYSAMRDALGKPLLKHAGIEISPHLYRHAIAKIVIERHPELMFDLSRRLGHKSPKTTYQSYLGTEGPSASRRINDLLTGLRDDDDEAGRG